jgi:type IV pilus assembly protein PilC
MATFNYTAVNKTGKREAGTIEAQSASLAGHLLKEQGLLPTDIEEKGTGGFSLDSLRKISFISLDEKIGFVENLGIMLKAGIAISKALQILVKQSKNLRFKNVLSEVYSKVEAGKSLSDALSDYPNVFSDIVINMIRVGELSGNLEKSLEYLSIQLHREADLKSKVKGAMIYPSVIVSAMFLIGLFLAIFVLPKLTSIFKDFGSDLPVTTKIVMAIADFMSAHGITCIIGLGVFIGLFIAFLRSETGQRALDYFLLHFMIINPIVKKINLARFSRILSSLLKSGVPIVQGLDVSSNSMGNVYYKELVAGAASDVKLGKSLTDSLGKDTKLFPVLVVQMLQVGEESGTVQEILEQLAMHYEEEVDSTMSNMSSVIEPLLLLFIGVVVGFLAMALIAPIYSISQNIS